MGRTPTPDGPESEAEQARLSFVWAAIQEWQRVTFFGYAVLHDEPPTSAYIWRMEAISHAHNAAEQEHAADQRHAAETAQPTSHASHAPSATTTTTTTTRARR
jgi:hypothetical protein